MARQQCGCGAVYRFPESEIGKRAKCKHCGELFLLTREDELATIPIADEPTSFGTGVADDAPGTSSFIPPIPEPGSEYAEPTADPAEQQAQGYGQDLLWSLLFPLSPENWASCGALCFVLLVIPIFAMIPVVGWVLALLILGFFAAYRFAVLAAAADGEEGLPNMDSDDMSIEGVAGGLFKWFGSWGIVLLPVAVFCTLSDRPVPTDIMGGVGGVMNAVEDNPVAVGLFGVGLFLWPMVILCVALGGFSSLIRPDLLFRTIVRTFPVYLLTVGVVFGAHFIGALFGGLQPIGGPWIAHLFGVGASIYTEIVAMRAIGHYYHHFKHRFLWDWG